MFSWAKTAGAAITKASSAAIATKRAIRRLDILFFMQMPHFAKVLGDANSPVSNNTPGGC